ncbi:hypothetical protein PPYR_12485 [Photinus pyralis]|uniref:Helicase domino n=1 Tax=Photinus pyralis TaxID=7054 RepID=A0A5N4AE99_PHOPY|nr:hypothetical protein PPYR_12485 [Photinus pyralis]
MSDESSGAGQGALPPREDFTSRNVVERPAVRLAQVAGGQYLLTSQTHGIPALAQISGSNASTANTSPGVTRIISLSPSRVHTSTLRPSLANQNIVNALTKPRATGNVRTQLFQATTVPNQVRSPVKRALSTTEEKDSYSVKLQRVMNHRNVRSKIVKEKYNEHLTEKYYLETSGNILDLPLFARRPPTPHYLTYLKENAIDPKEVMDDEETQDVEMKPDMTNSTTTVPTTPSASNSLDSFSSTNGLKVKATSSYSTPNNQEQIVEKAKQEAYVVQRISDLQKEGLWSDKRLPKIQEMPRVKAHWDFLIEEMVWLAADFAQERKWKKAAAKKCAKMVQKHFQDKASAAQRAEKAQEQHLKRVAAFCAKEIKSFWTNVEKLVEYKQNMRLEEKRKRALDQHLSFIVDQTEKYSQLLAEGMNKSVVNTTISEGPSAPSSKAPSRNNSDDEFQPDHESTDDEETIRQEEETAGEQGHGEEVAALQRESEMDLETFLNELPKDYLANRDKIQIGEGEETSDDDKGEGESTRSRQSEDEDFVADSSSEEDNEDTIKEQEKVEGKQNHKEELDDLKAENEVSVEDLRKKYSNLPPIPDAEDTPSDSDYSGSNGDGEDEDSSDASDVCSDVDISISESEDHEDEIGLKSLLDGSGSSQNEGDLKTDNQDLIDDAAAIAESIQPKGNTLSSTSVATPIPFLLRYTLREYQHIGLDWLVTMFDRKLNGILADEMGLGKTIQTIALLAHLACEKENWGPHLIIVPTSVMLNWEMECKKWCPAFKILTYYGTQKERKQKRMGWTKPNAFHICITSYKLVIQDHQSFRRKKWKYLILDEAQNIKNFKSQRWQLLLNFSTQQRLLLTGTPLQNNLMELWSLMHFLMPHVFQSHREFKEWFSNPVTGMIEGNSEYNESIIKRLHKVLRPFLLRRLKSEVEKQMPKKYEHIVMCRLSKRQRYLYDDYMSRAKTRETLATGNLLSVINVLMQLRKVCNHPNLFEVRPTISPFQCEGITWHIPSVVYAALEYDVWKHINLYSINFNLILMELYLSAYQCYRMRQYQTPRKLIEEINSIEDPPPYCPPAKLAMHVHKLQQPSDVKVDCKDEVPKPGQAINTQANLRLKIAPQSVLQLVQHNPLKVLAHQTGNGNQTIPTTVNLTTVLKQDKLMFQPGIAQLVQTSTGKHILLAPTTNATIPSNLIPGSTTVVTTGGQRLTLLPKQAVCAGQVTNITKGLPKIQLMSVNSQPSAGAPNISELKMEEEKETGRKTVGNTFINKLYSLQSNNLDVRWKKQKAMSPKRKHLINDKGEIEITDHHKNKLDLLATVNERRCGAVPLYGKDFQDSIKIVKTSDSDPLWCSGRLHCLNALFNMSTTVSDCLKDVLYTPERRIQQFKETFDRFIFYVPAVHAPEPRLQVWHPNSHVYWGQKREMDVLSRYFSKPATCLHSIASAMVTQFPDPRLIQYDCGKLQTLDRLLRKLKTDGHRVLIFTQMTKMLDVLEAFLNFHGHIYLRLDGSTKVDQRQVLMERFNSNTRIFAFILSTRSGGIGVNLTGADTVIFYDSDWNPTMDAQAQDRCHRIGQTRDVHIYRLVSERTIEENILKKANQKRLLGDLAIEGGNFTTAYFKSTTIQDLFNIDSNDESATSRMSEMLQMSREREKQTAGEQPIQNEEKGAMGALENALATCEDDQDVIAARTAKAEAVADLAEFDENIPLEDQEKDKEKEPELSKAEQEMENLVKQLTPVERYAMRFIEETEAAWSAEQLAAAEREIDEQKREWEQNRLAALKEEEERRARELEEENDMLTYSREDATNQVSIKNKRLGNQKSFKKIKRGLKSSQSLRRKLVRNYKPEVLSDSDSDLKTFSKTDASDFDDTSRTPTENSDSTYNPKVNGGVDSDFKSEVEEELENSDSSNSASPIFENHVDHNSPRTRSRGTVAINLWTLDVSPILPGVRPVKNASINNRRDRKTNDSNADDDSDRERRRGNSKALSKFGHKKSPSKMKSTRSKIDESESDDSDTVASDSETSPTESEVKPTELRVDKDIEKNLKSCQVIVTDILTSIKYRTVANMLDGEIQNETESTDTVPNLSENSSAKEKSDTESAKKKMAPKCKILSKPSNCHKPPRRYKIRPDNTIKIRRPDGVIKIRKGRALKFRNKISSVSKSKLFKGKVRPSKNSTLDDWIIWVSDNTEEYMPMWCPPTPPQQDTDVYIDHTLSFLYDINVMSESQLPPVYIKKDTKRSRLDAGLIDSRRAMKIQRKDDSVYAPKSLFERPSPALVKMRRDLKLQKYRGIVRPPVPMPGVKLSTSKPATDQPCWHNWTVHEDMALLKVIQSLQGLPLNLMILSPGHTPNWDFVADYVNTVSITYRSPKQCRNRYETVIIPREEGKQIFDTTPRKKKNKLLYKLTVQTKTNRPMRTSQLYTQDNNCTFSQLMIQRYEALKSMSTKRTTTTKTVLNSPALKNPKHTAVLNECGIDIDHPVLPVEVAARRAERLAREKKSMTPEQLAMAQRIQLIKAGQMSGGQVTTIQTSIPQIAAVTTAAQTVVSAVSQTQTSSIVSTVTATVMSTAMSTPSTPPGQLRTQRIIAAPIQTPTVVSVSGLSPAQLQAATQRLIVSGTPAQAKAVVGATAAVTGKPITPAQLQLIRQSNLKQQQLRLQPGSLTAQAVKTSSVAIGGQTTVQVQFTQAQPRAQFLKHGTVSLANKQGLTRTVTEAEMAQIIKRQQQIQQQKVLAAAAAGGAQPTTVQNLAPQVYAQTIQQAGTSGTQVATLVKTVSSAGVTQTVTIPVTGVTIGGAPVKATLAPGIKTTTPPQIRHLQLQQQLLAQKKLMNQKIGITQVTTTKGGVATQLIVGSKPIQTAMTMQQLQQVMRTPLTGVAQGSMVLAKGSSRVIPVNTGQGGKQTIQMVAASQGLTTTIRPQTSSALAGALAGIKVQGATAQTQQALLTHVSALQGQNVAVRQNSPVRIQTASGTPLVAVTVQSPNIQQGSSTPTANTDIPEQLSSCFIHFWT